MSCTPLKKEDLKGVWPALLTPWTHDDRVDADRLAEEIKDIAQAGLHGTYTGGTAGEFYAQDDCTFETITQLACHEAQRNGLRIQIGCTALSTRSVCRRIQFARSQGADAIQLALPFWMPLTDSEVLQFFDDVVDVAESVPVILYQTQRAKRRVDPPLLGEIVRRHPTLMGIKDTACSYTLLQEILADSPDLVVFGTDIDLLERMRLGARGTYSSFAGLNPAVMLSIYEHCENQQFDLAEPYQNVVRRLTLEVIRPLADETGLLDSAIDRLKRAVGGGSVGLRCQPPYRSASEGDVDRVRSWCNREAPFLLGE